MRAFRTKGIPIPILLFVYYLFITDYHIYLTTIYFLVVIYNIYKIYGVIKYNWNKDNNNELKYFIISIALFLFSYFLIYDPNPIYYLFTFYLPFPNYFKSVFILIFHSYFLNYFSITRKKSLHKLALSPDSETIHLSTKIQHAFKFEYFLSKLINYFKKKKIKLFLFIIGLIIIKIIIYFYQTKYWIYFAKKEKVLPISTKKNTKYYITSCIYNMEPIIVDFINEIKKLIDYLGEEKVIVSFVENGDSTDKTRDYLIEFRTYLNSKNILNKFELTHKIEDPRRNVTNKREKKYYRIKYLADLRNECFDFLYEIPNLDFENIKIINFNDIIFTYEEVIKLISTNKEDYDVVCAMDFYYNFYDNWASVDLNGNSLRHGFPYFINKEAQDQFINTKPIRIFSCWNGLIVINGSPFKDRQIEFRVENLTQNVLYKLNSYAKYEDNYESECTYFHIDLQYLGYNKRLLNSNIRVAYTYGHYYFSKYILPNTLELIYYFGYYLQSFTEKRNNYMSNLKSKNVRFSERLKNWYFYHSLNKTKTNNKI